MNYLKTAFNKFTALMVVALFTIITGAVSINYAQSAPDVVFNNAQGVDIGDERDFLRINDANGGNVAEACQDGDMVNLWFYVHNTNPTFMNGDDYTGAGVATGTTVDLDFSDPDVAMEHVVEGTVTADNAATSRDTVNINCGANDIELEFVSQNLVQDPNAPEGVEYTLTGNIMDGATLGMTVNGETGVVPGCFEYRAYIEIKVRIKVQPPEELHPAVCDLLEAVALGSKTVRVNDVEYTANDATINDISIEYGDGNTATVSADKSELPIEHTYAEAGEYTIVATVNTTFKGQPQAVTSDRCKDTLKVEVEKTPVYSCDDLTVSFVRENTYKFTVDTTAENGAEVKDYAYTFGDDSEVLLTDKNIVEHTFDGPGAYNASVVVRFNVNGQMVTPDNNDNCKVTITFSDEKCEIPGKEHLPKDDPECKEEQVKSVKKKKVLPSTGAGSIAGAFAAITAAGAAGHSLVLRRRK